MVRRIQGARAARGCSQGSVRPWQGSWAVAGMVWWWWWVGRWGGWGGVVEGGTWAHREGRIQVCRQAAALQRLRRLDEARRDTGRPFDDACLLHLGEARSPGKRRVERVGHQLACGRGGAGRG